MSIITNQSSMNVMKRNIFLSLLGIVAMLAACSSNEDLQGVAAGDVSTVTISARLDNGLKTRATYDTDDEVKRCLIEVREAGSAQTGTQYTGTSSADGTFQFSLTLKKGAKYDFLFWADDGKSYSTENLSAITLHADAAGKPGIAYFGRLTNTALSSEMEAKLTHAVGKVTLKTTGTLPAGNTVKVNIPTHAGFDVSKGEVTGTAAPTDFSFQSSKDISKNEVFSFYVLAPSEESLADEVAVSCGSESTKLTYVPLQMNYRTVLEGDVANINKVSGTITAKIDADWAGTKGEQAFPQINLKDGEALTEDLIKVTISNGTLVIKGNMTDDDFKTLGTYMGANLTAIHTLDLGDCTATAIPDNLLCFSDGNFMKKVEVSKLILPRKVVSIGESAFRSTKITSLVLPETLTTIGESAFRYGDVTTLTIPASVTSIGSMAFQYQSKLSELKFQGKTPPSSIGQVAFTWDKISTIYVPSGSKNAYLEALNKISELGWDKKLKEY